MDEKINPNQSITGILPAAGFASRLPNLPCSKEIYPIGLVENCENQSQIKVVSSSLLNHMHRAGASSAHMIIRKEKWDIPNFLGDGKDHNLNLSYLITPPTKGTPYSILKAIPFVKNKTVLFGFPDIQIEAFNPFGVLLRKLKSSKADVILGLFKAKNPEKVDMVETEVDGTVKNITIKPETTSLTYTWLLAVWTSAFSGKFKELIKHSEEKGLNREIYVGDLLNSAISMDFKIESILIENSDYTDIGTIDDLFRPLIKQLTK